MLFRSFKKYRQKNGKLLDIIDRLKRYQKQGYKIIVKTLEIKDADGKIIEKREDKIKQELKDNIKQRQSQAINLYESTQGNLAIAFYTLSENIVRYAKFNLIDADDAVQEGVLVCFEKLDRFNPKFGKAFNYMTTCILNHFKQLYRSARNYNELKKRYQDFMIKEVENEICCSKTPGRKD